MMKIHHTLTVLDLETTGTWIENDKIIDIGMIKHFPDGRQETFSRKINPGMPIPPRVTQLTGITNDDVKDAPAFKDIAKEIFDFIGDSDFAGFNVGRFDLPLLEREMREAGLKFEWQKRKIYDAQKIYHVNEKRDLNAAYNYYCNKPLANAHTALADAQASFEILQQQVEKYGEGSDIQSLDKYDYRTKDDLYYDEDRKFRWWNGKLYMMFGKYARKYTLQDIVKKDPSYLEWIISADFSEEIKTLVEDALKGKFPEFKEPILPELSA